MVYEVKHLLECLELFQDMVGKEGPCYFDCGVIAHNHFLGKELWDELNEAGVTDKFPIGKKGQAVTMGDILDTLQQVCSNERLDKVQYSGGRSYFHEGYRVSEDGKTVIMIWGS
ncbi:hypothetical protein ACHAXR_009506 [Thalassiosira sp. AJA248-18]